MTRLSARHLVQQVDDNMFVISDDTSGEEIVLDRATIGRLVYALLHVFSVQPVGPGGLPEEPAS